MKRLQKLGLAITSAVALGAFATASIVANNAAPQSKPPAESKSKDGMKGHCGGKHRGMMKGRMMKELNLTEQQLTLIKPVWENAKAEMKALKGNTSLSKEEKRAKVKAIFEAARNDMNQFLDASQKAKMEQWKSRWQNRKSGVKPPKVSPTSA